MRERDCLGTTRICHLFMLGRLGSLAIFLCAGIIWSGAANAQPGQAGLRVEALEIRVDGKEIEEKYALLVPAAESVHLSVALPEPGNTARTGRALTSGHGGVDRARLVFESTSRITWAFNGGTLATAPGGDVSGTEVLWMPGQDGRLSTVEATLESSTQAAGLSGLDVSDFRVTTETQASGAVSLLPAIEVRHEGDGLVEDVVIGVYPNQYDQQAPSVVRRNPSLYQPPASFYRLDEVTRRLQLSPHATMGLLNPDPVEDSETRFVALDPGLLVFWEALCEEVAEEERTSEALNVLRGFVTPHERQRLDRLGVKLADFTRYQYGDALAIIYDRDGDFRMDDLDGSGTIDIGDAVHLGGLVEEAMRASGEPGGIGICASFEGPNHIGTPYVHADLRGWWENWREE